MAIFQYNARTISGEAKSGQVEAPNMELAISALQRRSLVILSLVPAEDSLPWYKKEIFSFGSGIKLRDVVILSRQMATLFEARVPVVDSLKVLSNETMKPKLKKALTEISQDIQGGLSITQAMSRHPEVFSDFYVNMVRSGEESGKLEEIFSYLADYLDRSYELVSKARNALIYPIFVFIVFIAVMALVMVFIIPQVSKILIESGAEIPIYTRIIMSLSDFLRSYGIVLLMLIVLGGLFLWRYSKTEKGSMAIARLTLETPVMGEIFRKFYVARITDNLETLIVGGVTVLRALELSSKVVGNALFKQMIEEAGDAVRGGVPISEAFGRYKDMPLLVVQMIKIGEETGKLDFMLKTLARFYRKEVENTVDNLVGLIEPVMIIFLGIGVAILVVSVLMPIYNISAVL
ncbi:type II secretion system F family protein [Candidatus Giovannonibacteria bacterium]|nr:type II secretion system F family protein [Candidatus Giovannonibacteria bacterium]